MSRARIGVIALLALTFIAAACAQPPSGGTGGLLNATTWSTNPKDTDPQISSDATFTNLAYAPVGPARGRLAVVLHGTGSSPQAYTELAGALRGSGFHVIVLRYSAALGTQGACPDANAATDPDCFRVFRSETVFGANVADPTGHAYDQPLAAISQSNSVMNRLLKYVEYLRTVTPSAGWDQFQQRSGTTCTQPNTTYGACDLKWDKVVGVGHSQGAGVALYLAKFFPLDRVAMLSGSFDAFDLGDGSFTVAPWITEGGLAVPASRIGTLTHYSDYGLGRIRAVEDALGVPGPEVSAASPPPFDGSRRLMTNLASTCPWDSAPGHNSTAVDLCVPDYAYSSAWTYLAGV